MRDTSLRSQKSSCNNTPRLSAEVFVLPLEHYFIVYAPLRRAAFVANSRSVNFLADLQANLFDPSADPDGAMVEFLRRMEILDAEPETKPLTHFQGDPQPTSVTLFLTTACNLRCTYCYASAGDTPTKHMSLEVARRGIDFVAANAVRRKKSFFEIAYHGGGEPSVNWGVMTASLDYARQKASELGIKVKASSATNGVLSPAQLEWIIAYLDGVSLSFDGLPSAHDRHRLTVLGEGSTQPAGQAHAEIMALRDAHGRGLSVEGATAYVTLEPCSHHGRTGPCCDALADAGLSKVFASITDPNPMVAGQGVSRLRERGVEVDVGLESQASRELNLGFFSRMIRRRPWVRMKAAASLDGLTALHGGESQWITSPLARACGVPAASARV